MTVDDLIDDGSAPAETPDTTSTDAATQDTSVAPEPEQHFGPPDEADESPTPDTSDVNSAAKTVEEPKVADTPAAGQVDEQLLADAELVGYTRAEAMSMAPQALEKSIRVALRNAALAKRDAVERMAEIPTAAEFKIDLDPNEYDEKVIGTFQKMKEHYDKQLSDLRNTTMYAAQHAQEVEQQTRARFEQEFTSKFDTDLAALKLDDVFGQGSISELSASKNDTAFQNRLRVIEHMEMDAERYLRRGERPPTQDQLFQRAIRAEFGDRLIQNQQQSISKQVEKRAAQIVPRPGSSPKAKTATGFNAVKDKFREILGREADTHTVEEMLGV